jgi:hypothetical protein
VTVTLREAVPLQVTAKCAATGRPLRFANFHVTGGGADYWTWGGVLPPPGAPAPEFAGFMVPPGPVTIQADSPGYVAATRVVQILPDDDPAVVVVRLDPRAPGAGGV